MILEAEWTKLFFEEFKGTGNSETVLDRKIADKRIYPAIDITKSGTRREELLFDKNDLQKMNVLRRIIAPMGTMDAIEFINSKLKDTKNNAEFFNSMNKPCLLYTSPSPRDGLLSRMPSSA